MPGRYYFGAMLAFAYHRARFDNAADSLLFAFSFAVVASLDTLICSRIGEGMTGPRTAGETACALIAART